MSVIPPAALQAPVRPVASSAMRFIASAGVGFAGTAGLAFWADNKYGNVEPDAGGGSPGRIDKYEARQRFSGHDGIPAYLTFGALLSASFLYSHGRMPGRMTDTEFNFIRNVGYGMLGGGLAGTAIAPSLLKPLD